MIIVLAGPVITVLDSLFPRNRIQHWFEDSVAEIKTQPSNQVPSFRHHPHQGPSHTLCGPCSTRSEGLRLRQLETGAVDVIWWNVCADANKLSILQLDYHKSGICLIELINRVGKRILADV